jgi:WD40 repeat protein
MTNKLPLHISPDRPYTHSQQVRSFIIAKIDGQMFVMTGGGEGTIRFWKFDPISTTFKLLKSLEGHLRDITALWYDEGGENGLLWSGSTVRTIRVWRVNNGECIATLVLSTDATGQTTPGHDGVISCFEKVTIDDTIYLASGGGDGNVIIWNTTDGSYAQHCSHGNVFISAMKTVTDPSGTSLLVIAVTNGKLYLRALDNQMTLLCVLENGCQRNFVWGIVDLYGLVPVNNESPSCFVTAGDDGKLILWSINASLLS